MDWGMVLSLVVLLGPLALVWVVNVTFARWGSPQWLAGLFVIVIVIGFWGLFLLAWRAALFPTEELFVTVATCLVLTSAALVIAALFMMASVFRRKHRRERDLIRNPPFRSE